MESGSFFNFLSSHFTSPLSYFLLMITKQKNWLLLILIIFFSLFVIYGTTIPFKFTSFHAAAAKYATILWHPFQGSNSGWTSRFDLIQNVLLFFPAGVLLGILFSRLNRLVAGISVSFFYGLLLSSSVEIFQLFTADRIVSITDVICNTAGSVVGCVSIMSIWSSMKKESRLLTYWYGISRMLIVPIIIFVFVMIEFLRPFDFSLDINMVFEKIRLVKTNSFMWTPAIRNYPITLLFYMVLTFTVLRSEWFSLLRLGQRFLTGVVLFLSVFVLAGCQLIIISRLPAGLDIISGIAGVVLGIPFCKFRGPIRIFIFQTLLFVSVLCMYIVPFTVASEYQKGNWSLVLFSCSSTMMWYAGHAIELIMFFTFAGFSTLYLVKHTTLRNILIFFDIGIVLIVESFQVQMRGSVSGIIDLIVALGALSAGMLIKKSV